MGGGGRHDASAFLFKFHEFVTLIGKLNMICDALARNAIERYGAASEPTVLQQLEAACYAQHNKWTLVRGTYLISLTMATMLQQGSGQHAGVQIRSPDLLKRIGWCKLDFPFLESTLCRKPVKERKLLVKVTK
ncbi:hypothetical protein FRX31_016276 [Thalictrum thalictroides]|uniref:Uncharacterized protein n=1 Tax=Thalictrum thalictroides TaxID=46969 RepID=A0A7J6WCM9_THATH|nr:hypothetical protein FRX31_016276 [Thalictrum thalictroides]